MEFRASVFDAADLRRAITRIAHEIVERNHGADDVVLVGLYTRGVAIARRLAAAIERVRGRRRSRSARSTSRSTATTSACARSQPLGPTEVPVDITRPGRRARRRRALHRPHGPRRARRAAPSSAGPARCSSRCSSTAATASCRSAADYVGKNLPTRIAEDVRVRLAEVDGARRRRRALGQPRTEHARATEVER